MSEPRLQYSAATCNRRRAAGWFGQAVVAPLRPNTAKPLLRCSPHHSPGAPVATQGGEAHTPRKATTFGWRSAAIMLASLQVAWEVWSGEGGVGGVCER